MFDFFHKNKQSKPTTVNPNTYVTPQVQTQTPVVQPSIQTSSNGQNPHQQQSSVQNTVSMGVQDSVQTKSQASVQTQTNNQAVVVNPRVSVSTTVPTQNGVTTNLNLASILNDDEQKTLELINALVLAMTGYSPLDIDSSERERVISECVKIFSDYLIKFVELQYGVADATRLKASQKFEDQTVFTKFAELGPKFDAAYDSFIGLLEKQNSLQTT
jgi:hypothetical protein